MGGHVYTNSASGDFSVRVALVVLKSTLHSAVPKKRGEESRKVSSGAVLLHQATSTLLYQNGNILGLSGYLRQLFSAPTKEHLAFFTGMAASYVPLKALAPQLITTYPALNMTPKIALATAAVGALIGWGTKVSGLC